MSISCADKYGEFILYFMKRIELAEEEVKYLGEFTKKINYSRVAEREKEINELVYKLYRLTEEDVNVVEDFMRRF